MIDKFIYEVLHFIMKWAGMLMHGLGESMLRFLRLDVKKRMKSMLKS